MSDIEIVVLEDTPEDSSQQKTEAIILPYVSIEDSCPIEIDCTKTDEISDEKNKPNITDVDVKNESKQMKNDATESKAQGKRTDHQFDENSDENVLIDLGLKSTKIPKRKSQITDEDIQNLIVKCSACGKQVNHHYKERIKKHRHLGVLICKECFQFYSEGEFSEDDTGYNYCRWCAQGGKLYGCDFCPNTFCFECVRRNFGRGEVRRIQDEAKWKCYLCEPSTLKEKVAFCDMILHYAEKLKDKKAKKLTKLPRQPTSAITSDSENDVSDTAPAKWLPFHINRIIFLCAKLQKKMFKLNRKHEKKEKSLKQVVAKYCELIDTYSADISGAQKNVQNKYNHYFQQKMKSVSANKDRSQKGSDNCKVTIVDVSDDSIMKSDIKSHDGILNGIIEDADQLMGKQGTEKCDTNNVGESIPKLDASVENSISDCNLVDEEDISVPNHSTVSDLVKAELIVDCEISKEADDTGELDVDITAVEETLNSVSEKEDSVNDKQVLVDCVESEVNLPLVDDSKINSDSDCKKTSVCNNDQNVLNESSEHTSKDEVVIEQQVSDSLKQDDSDHSVMQSQSLLSDCLPEIQNESTSGDLSHNAAIMNRLQNSIDEVLEKNEAAKQTLLSQMFNSDSDNSIPSVPKQDKCNGNHVDGSKISPKNKAPLQKGKKYKGIVSKKPPFKMVTEPNIAENSEKQPKLAVQKQSRVKASESSLSSSPSSSDSEVAIRTKKSKLKDSQKCEDKIYGEESISSKNSSNLKIMLKHYADLFDDPKLLLQSDVYLEKLMLKLENDSDLLKSAQTAEVNKKIDGDALDDKKEESFNETFRKLSNLPKRKKKNTSTSESDHKDASTKKIHRKTKRPKIEEADDSCSDSFSLSSTSEGDEMKKLKPETKLGNLAAIFDKNELAKASLLDMKSLDSDLSSDSDIMISPKKITKTKGVTERPESKGNSDSDNTNSEGKIDSSEDDFKLPTKKKGKYEKLLRASFMEQNSDSGAKEKPTKKTKEKKRTKRKIISSDEDGADKKKSSSSSPDSSSSDSSGDFKTKRGGKNQNSKAKKRKRIKVAENSSNSEAGNHSDVEVIEGSQETPSGKGRKNIRKIISNERLTEETKEAAQAEKERRRRVTERQKLYNQITEVTGDRGEMITKKMVLEVDPDSKEEVVEIHPDIVEKLKPHQVNGVKFMWECTIESLKQLKSSPGSGCILAHCMGLGKTLQVIAFLYTVLTNKYTKEHLKTALVICPYNTVLNWAKEFDIWLEDVEESINIYEMAGAKDNYTRKDILQLWQEEGGILIIGYDIFRRLVDGKMPRISKKLKTSVFNHLADPGPDIVICDEGHILKNESSAVSKATTKLKTQRRIVLTGTPLQNNLREYHCMVHFVKPHLLGTSKEFRNRFVNPIINGQCADSSQYDVKRMKKRVHILHKLLQGCVQRCDYSALTKFLPDKREFVISVKLSDVQIKMYSYFLETLAQGQENAGKVEGRQLFKDYNSLKNIWSHPYLVEKGYIRHRDAKMFSDTESEGSLADFIDDGSSSSKSEDEVTLLDDNKPSTSKGKDGDSSGEEIINKWKTRSRGRRGKKGSSDEDEESREAPPEQQHWWNKFFTEEENYKLELSGKMVLVFEILKECELIGDKVLIFSTSLLTLNLLEELLAAEDEKFQVAVCQAENSMCQDYIGSWALGLDYFRMDGSTNIEMRKKWIEIFNDKNNERARLFLISTKAGSLGTNLVGANRVILLDASWNPSHDVQAIFRVYRFGQVKPVYIYRLLAQGTMEEKIYDRQVTKLSLQCRVIDEQNIERHFNASELTELYKFDPEGQSNRPTPMVPKDRLLAELLIKHKEWIVTYHEHDSLLQNVTEDDLTEEERQSAWQEYENEREGLITNNNAGNMFNSRSFINFDPNINYELPNADKDVKRCIEYIKNQNIGAGPELLLNKGVVAVANLKRHYGEILNKIRNERIRIAQVEPVPEKMDSYIEALVTAISKTDMYINQLKQQFINYNLAKTTQWRAQQQQAQQQQWNAQKQYANVSGNSYSFVGRPPTYTNFPRGTQNWQNNARGFTAQGVRIVQLSSTPGTGPNGNVPSAATSSSASNGTGPIITEVTDNTSFDQQQTQPSTRSRAPSTVTITELD